MTQTGYPTPHNFIKVDEEQKESNQKSSASSMDSLNNLAAFSDDETGPDLAKRHRNPYSMKPK